MWGSPVEIETRNRIRVCIYAYAYEIRSNPVVSDADFDTLALKIDLTVKTTNPTMDTWFERNFTPYSGSWIHSHPNLHRIEQLYNAYYT